MTDEPQNSKTPKRSRRWLRFGFRTMLVVVTCIALFLGLILIPTLKQKESLEQLDNYLGSVSFGILYDYQKRAEPVGYSHWNLNAELPGPEFLHKLLGMDAFRTPVSVGVHYGGPEDDSFYEDLNRIQTWQDISLDGTQLTDSMISKLTGQPHLKELRVNDTNISDKGCESIAKLGSIRELYIGQNQKLSDAGLAKLGNLTRLKELHIGDCQLNGTGFENFQNPLSLIRLSIGGSSLCDESGKWIGRFKNLQTLYLHKTNLSDTWIANLESLPNLKWIGLHGCSITGEGFRDWPVSQQETGIGIGGTNVDDERWLLIKSKFPNSTIEGMGSGMTRSILPHILAQPELTSLSINQMELTREDFVAISRCTTLKHLNLDGTNIDIINLQLLPNLKQLETLSLKECVKLTDEAFTVFAQLSLGELNVSSAQYSADTIKKFDRDYGWIEIDRDGGVIFTAW